MIQTEFYVIAINFFYIIFIYLLFSYFTDNKNFLCLEINLIYFYLSYFTSLRVIHLEKIFSVSATEFSGITLYKIYLQP